MTIFEYNRPRAGIFYSWLIMDKKIRANALIVIMVGVFLLPKTAHLSTITEEKIVELTNIERTSSGLPTLSVNDKLTAAAKAKAAAIIITGDFSHSINGRSFSAWVRDENYEYSIVGENLAIDFATSEGVLKAWRNSPSHLKNILNDKYEDIGVAVIEGPYQGENTIVVAQIFGTPNKEKEDKEVDSASKIIPKKQKTSFTDFLSRLISRAIDNQLPLPILSTANGFKSLSLLNTSKEILGQAI